MKTDTSKSLLDRLRTASTGSDWDVFVDLYQPFIQRVLRCRHIPQTDIEDLCQDIFACVVKGFNSFRHNGRPGAFRTWLGKIISHRVWKFYQDRPDTEVRKISDTALSEIASHPAELEQQWEAEHDQYLIHRLLEIIKPEFTETTWRSFLECVIKGRDVEDVAAELKLSTNAVAIARSRVMRRLRVFSQDLLETI
ncbi:MAG TPA: sigma-70 family RNA polymerase sigma factor [Pirellulaceae bacterium]|nr:sigma-70 family RNA polymerase sigma factor [Pirellulaceae bacterium]HMO91822.1 sigma-70 family RNA polymerase sigma factor [Pirellulaceae bacterium]HMP69885.1 sigma-70 family RNA polymerase sigma factor [Pirellulaceae bacterium]